MDKYGTDKQYVADSLIQLAISDVCTKFVPNFKVLSKVVPEKSLTKKKLTDKLTSVQKR